MRRNGARLVSPRRGPSTLDANADAALRFAPGAAEAALAALAAALDSPRAADASLDALAERAGAVAGFGRAPSANGDAVARRRRARGAAALGEAGDVVVIWGERIWGASAGRRHRGAPGVATALGLQDRPGRA